MDLEGGEGLCGPGVEDGVVKEVDVMEEEDDALVKLDGSSDDDRIQLIEVRNLVVSPAPLRRIALGDVDSLLRTATDPMNGVSAVVWNEREIALVGSDRGVDLRFTPVFEPATTMFFQREEKHRGMFDQDAGTRIWEGDYEPVQFTKKDLLAFLGRFSELFDERVREAVKNLQMRRSTSSTSEMLDLDGESERTVEEVTEKTNLPRRFSARLPMFDGISADLEFEARVKERQANKSMVKVIELRCTNAREAMRATMEQVLSRIPTGLPLYYGSVDVRTSEGRRW